VKDLRKEKLEAIIIVGGEKEKSKWLSTPKKENFCLLKTSHAEKEHGPLTEKGGGRGRK